MELFTAIFVTIIAGILSSGAFYYTFSKKIEEFYVITFDTNDSTGIFLFVGLLGKGLHKLYKKIFLKHHYLALRITTFIFGLIF